MPLLGHDGRASSAYAPDGDRVATGDASGRVRVFEVPSGTLIEEWDEEADEIGGLAFHPDATLLAVAAGGRIRLHDLEAGGVVHEFGDAGAVTSNAVEFAPDGSVIAFGTTGTGRAPFEIRDAASGALVAEIGDARKEAISLRYAPHGCFLATVTRAYDGRRWVHWISLWSPRGELRLKFEAQAAWKVAASPDGSRIAASQYQPDVTVWNGETGELVATLRGHTGQAWGVDWHPADPNLVASCGDDGTVRLWDVGSEQSLLTLDAFPGGYASSVRFGADGETLLVDGSKVLLWDLTYFDRHIAGNARYQIERLLPEGSDSAHVRQLEAWVDEALARPWPRFAR